MKKFIIFIMLVSACESADKKLGYSQANFTFKDQEPLLASTPRAAAVGKEISIMGSQFQNLMQIKLNGQPVAYTYVSDREVKVLIPADATTGKLNLDISQGVHTKHVDNLYALADTKIPLITTDPGKICDTMLFYDADGNLKTGTKKCTADVAPNCTMETQTGCIVSGNDLTLVASKSLATENIKTGVTLAGITGSFDNKPISCLVQKQKNCVVDSDALTLVDSTLLTPENIKLGVTIAGVAGTFDDMPTMCSAENQTGCVVNGNALSVIRTSSILASNIKAGATIGNVIGTYNNLPATCTAENQTGCVVSGSSLVLINPAPLTASNVKAGVTLGGILGTYDNMPATCSAESQTDCRVSSSGGLVLVLLAQLTPANLKSGVTMANVTGQYPSATYPLPDVTTTDLTTLNSQLASNAAFEWWNSAGTKYVSAGSSLLAASNIKTGVTIAGVLGTYDNMPATCSTENQTGCVVNGSSLLLASSSTLTAGNIKSGITIANVTGQYPNASYPLTAINGTADLTSLNSQLTKNDAFEWWDSAGTRYTGNGNVKLSSGYILTGNTLFGQTGSVIPTQADCATDGQTNCVAVSAYPAAKVANISTWDLRVGKSFGGVSGALKTNCRNTITSSYFNVSSNYSTRFDTSNDYWDTLNDTNGFPLEKVTAWSDGVYCDSTTWTDVTTTDGGNTNVSCGTGGICIYQDKITNLKITRLQGAATSWAAAISACSNSTYGGYPVGTWRMPSQKEALSAYEHGIMSVASSNFITVLALNVYMFSATTSSTLGYSEAVVVNIALGSSSSMTKSSSTLNSICVQ